MPNSKNLLLHSRFPELPRRKCHLGDLVLLDSPFDGRWVEFLRVGSLICKEKLGGIKDKHHNNDDPGSPSRPNFAHW